MSSSVPSPENHWVSAWQIAASAGHALFDAAERLLFRPWLLSVDDLGLVAEILPVAVFWTGLPGSPVNSWLVSTLPYLGAHQHPVRQ
eukprot:1928738-Amphidinium_carterae.1